MSEQIPERIGPYEIVEKLGKGGMAVVYKAVQTTLNRTVAVKVMSSGAAGAPNSQERFHREAHAVAMLNHPNVVQIIDKGDEDGLLYFVMEYVEGASLDVILHQRRLSFPEALRIFKEVCKGLEYAHQRKIIHRDLNPRNILVSPDLATVKLADFGICRVEALSRDAGTLSTSEVSMGTLHYLAPEQAMNMLSADHRSDIFSLGVLLYEMLTGKVPVGRFNLPSRLNQEVPAGVDPIVLKCLATDPKDRYDSVSQILEEVKKLEETHRLRLVDELKGISRSTGRMFRRSTQTFGRKTNLVMLAGVGLVAVALVLIYAIFWSGWRMPWQGSGDVSVEQGLGTAPLAGEPQDGTEPDQVADSASTGTPAESLVDTDPNQPDQTAATPPAVPPEPASDRAAKPATTNTGARNSSAKADEGKLEEIRSAFQSGPPTAALSAIDTFLENRPDSPVAVDGYLLKAEILHKMDRATDERAVYEEILRRFADDPKVPEAKYRLGELLRSDRGTGWEKKAIELFAEVGAHPNSPYAPPALAREGEIQAVLKMRVDDDRLKKNVPETLVTYRRLVEQFPDAPAAEYAYWSLANMYLELGEDALAASSYEELGRRFPGTHWDAWFSAAELYDKKIKDLEKAKNAYSNVPATSRNYDKARQRLEKLAP